MGKQAHDFASFARRRGMEFLDLGGTDAPRFAAIAATINFSADAVAVADNLSRRVPCAPNEMFFVHLFAAHITLAVAPRLRFSGQPGVVTA